MSAVVLPTLKRRHPEHIVPDFLLSFWCKVDIVQHGETNAKGTGVHAALLAPEDARIFRHHSGTSHNRRQDPLNLELPDYDLATTVVLFPLSKVRSTV